MKLINFIFIKLCLGDFNLHNFASYFQDVSGEVGFVGIDSYVEPVITYADQRGFDFLLYENVKNAFNNFGSPREFSTWLEKQKFLEIICYSNCEKELDLLACFHLRELRSALKKILAKNSFKRCFLNRYGS